MRFIFFNNRECFGKSRHMRLQENKTFNFWLNISISFLSSSFLYWIWFCKVLCMFLGLPRYKMEKKPLKSQTHVYVCKAFLFWSHSLSIISLILAFAPALVYCYEIYMNQKTFLQDTRWCRPALQHITNLQEAAILKSSQ